MIVCMVNDNFYRSSGAAIAIRRIAQALTGITYCVAGCGDGSLPENLSWVPAGKYEHFELKTANPVLLVSELLRFRRWFKEQGCDLVHCHHRRVAVLLQAMQIPVLYTGHLVFPYALWFRVLRPLRMTAVTPSVASNLLHLTGREVVACIGNPTQFPESAPSVDVDAVRDRAVCIARLEPVKGHKHLLAAWKLLRDRGYRYKLDLVGEGPLREELERQTVLDGTQDLVQFHGFTSDVTQVIRHSLFAILLSQLEGQGIVTLEAAALARASLLTAVPGSVDLLPPTRTLPNGLQFGDVQTAADAIETWFAAPATTLHEGKLFFDYLRSASDPGRIAREYVEIYEGIVAGAI